jgi:hypothetical protein
MKKDEKPENKFIVWILENQMKSVLILFGIIFLFSYALPEGGGMSFGSGSIFGNSTNVEFGKGTTESSVEIKFKKDALRDSAQGKLN